MRANLTRELLGMLLAVFVTLKVTDSVAWSWWWVLAPFWAPVLCALVGIGLFYVVQFYEQERASKAQHDWWLR